MNYPGGKGTCFRNIINERPPHRVYIEPFLGGGNVLVNKRAADVSIGIDIDAAAIENFLHAHSDMGVETHCMDALTYLGDYSPSGGDCLIYCDPPYPLGTRTKKKIYRHEFTDAQHEELLAILVILPCKIMVSSYANPLYRDFLEHTHLWRCVCFPGATRSGGRTESLWCNFDKVDHRHDARYLGANFRDRERIKRKRDRWRRRFEAMGAGERQVVMEALCQVLPPGASMVTATPDKAMGDRALPAANGDASDRPHQSPSISSADGAACHS